MVAVDVSSRGVQTSSPFVHANISLYDKEVFKAIRSLQQEYGADQGFTFNQIALRADVSRGTAVRSVGSIPAKPMSFSGFRATYSETKRLGISARR